MGKSDNLSVLAAGPASRAASIVASSAVRASWKVKRNRSLTAMLYGR